MHEINNEECIAVGYIQKPHGLRGELILVFDPQFGETLQDTEFLFLEVDGGLVPFFIEEDGFCLRTDESAICRLGFIDSLTKAKELVGCKVYVPGDEIIISEVHEITSNLIGMSAFDEKFGKIGLISRVDDFSGNLVITVGHPRAEIMIPLSDEVITSVDEEKREVYLSCPDGLIELYLA